KFGAVALAIRQSAGRMPANRRQGCRRSEAMVQKLQIDRWLFSATIGLALFGVVMVYSASAVIAQQENHSQFHYLIKQGVWTSIGLVAMFVAMNFDYQKLNRR